MKVEQRMQGASVPWGQKDRQEVHLVRPVAHGR